MTRNYSIYRRLLMLAEQHCPRLRFNGDSPETWRLWHETLLPEVLASLGKTPERVPLNAERIDEVEEDNLLLSRIVFDVEPGLSAVAIVCRPIQSMGCRHPAILCCHGHGPYGKDAVMGRRDASPLGAFIKQANNDYGRQMARRGYVTLAIDWRGFGERSDRDTPGFMFDGDTRDPCNVNQLRCGMLGYTMLGLNLHDARAAVDLLCDQPDVDPDRLGVMGLSLGGTMATWIGFTDPRIKAVDVICYSARFTEFGVRHANFCGSQITPALFDVCDVCDLQGLIAPKPLLVEIGKHDQCFKVEPAMECHSEVERIYRTAGVPDRLELDLFEGGHAWGDQRTATFFEKWI